MNYWFAKKGIDWKRKKLSRLSKTNSCQKLNRVLDGLRSGTIDKSYIYIPNWWGTQIRTPVKKITSVNVRFPKLHQWITDLILKSIRVHTYREKFNKCVFCLHYCYYYYSPNGLRWMGIWDFFLPPYSTEDIKNSQQFYF